MKKSLILLAAALVVSGCTLPEVPNRGDKCPPIDAEYESYLGQIGSVECSEYECEESDEDYSEFIATGFCPVEYPECGYDVQNEYYYCAKIACKINEHVYDDKCEKDTEKHCGSHQNKCSKLAGWADGACKNKRCVASECKENYILVDGTCEAHSTECKDGEHYYVEGTECENNTIENCGSHAHNCEKLSGWGNGVCSTDGNCIALSCTSGYVLDEENRCVARMGCQEGEHLYNGDCEPDSVENCGNHGNDCTQLSGWVEGDCTQGKCLPSLCDTGYELKNDKCEALIECTGDTHFYAGECEPDDIEHCGSHKSNCSTNAGWLDGTCVSGVCTVSACSNGYVIEGNKCVALSECPTGQHIDNSGSACEDDTVYNCGRTGYDCASNIPGWGSGNCTNAECVPTKCQSGYCLNNRYQCVEGGANKNACGITGGNCKSCSGTMTCYEGTCQVSNCPDKNHLYNGACEPDSTANCGKHGNACNLSNALENACDSGVCKATRCADGYHLYAGKCEKNDLVNCGLHNRSCSLDNATGLDCSTGICKATSCSNRYHLYNNKCEINDLVNCGSHANACSTNSIRTKVNCDYGTCRALLCASPRYHVYDGTCEMNSTTHCKYHNTPCTKDNVPNSATVSCSDGVCKALSCSSNYHVYENSCELDGNNHCGSHDKVCSKASIENSNYVYCSNKKCVLSSCVSGYHKYNETCEANSNQNCGSHAKACNENTIANSTGASCSTSGICKATGCKSYATLTASGTCKVMCATDKTYCESGNKCCSNGLCLFGCTAL